jgi:competence protein ComEC
MHLDKKEISLIIVLIIVAFTRFLFFVPDKPSYDIAVGKRVEIEGVVVDDPDIRVYNKRIILKPNDQDIFVLVVISKEEEVSYGDKVKISGILETPENFITSSGKEFNYEKYLANKNIYFIVNKAKIENKTKGNGNWAKQQLFKLRSSFIKNINLSIPSPKSDLANGLILGVRGGFDNDTKNEFISTGTIHIIALSGYNITIVAESVMKIFGLILSQTLSIIFGIFIIVLFILMTGASATAIRAGIMAMIVLFARLTGRNYDAGRALIIAGLLMITYDLRTINDISFQLSFLATAGVLFITPKIISFFRFLPIRFGFRELVTTTVSATIAVFPILLYITGIFSVVSIPVNILILPIIPITMLFSFIVGITGFISPVLSLPFAYVADFLLSYILLMVHFFASLPFASLNIKSFPIIITIIIYGLMFWRVFLFKKKT